MIKWFKKLAYDKGYRVGRFGDKVLSPIWNPVWVIEVWYKKEWQRGMREGLLFNTTVEIAKLLRAQWGMEE